MQADAALIRELIEAVVDGLRAHADELTALDQAIGDGDHGFNMARGAAAVLAERDAIASLPVPQMLQKIGTTLVMTVGGASGPLFGTLFLELGRAFPAVPTRVAVAQAFAVAVVAVQARGKSQAGQKTMLDVLVPLQGALAEGRPLRSAVAEGAAATVPMKALRGRAAYLGERSIGHMDPGARSTQLIMDAVIDVLEDRT